MSHGIFITFEGSEGCGKTTQIQLLAARFQRAGLPILLTREPGGTPLGESIRHLLKFADEGRDMTPEAELLLFAASRAQLIRRVIAPALAAGTWVIADRFLDSTTVYQGVARRLDYDSVCFINDFAVGDRLPDLTILLDLDTTEAQRRLSQRPSHSPDRMEQLPPDFYESVRQGYLMLAREEPDRFRVIQAARPIEVVEAEIWDHVEGLMGK
jgi:dTMP kinase